MMRSFFCLTCLLVTFSACSEDPSKGAALIPEVKSNSKAADVLNPILETGLNDVEKKVKAKDYEAAVGALIMLKDMQASPSDEEAYRKRIGETVQELNQAALSGDERARAAHQMLGRMIMGR